MILRRALAFSCAAWLLAVSAAQAAEAGAALPPGYSPNMSSDEAGLWMQMDKEGLLDEYKAKHPAAFKAMYKERYGVDYKG